MSVKQNLIALLQSMQSNMTPGNVAFANNVQGGVLHSALAKQNASQQLQQEEALPKEDSKYDEDENAINNQFPSESDDMGTCTKMPIATLLGNTSKY